MAMSSKRSPAKHKRLNELMLIAALALVIAVLWAVLNQIGPFVSITGQPVAGNIAPNQARNLLGVL